MDAYPYTTEWQAAADKSGEDWRAYCEATTLVKRFLKLELEEGRPVALHDYRKTIREIETQNRRSADQVKRLDQDFRLIGAHEAEVLRQQI